MSTWAHKYNAYRVQIVIIYLHVLFHKKSIALFILSTILLSCVLFVLTWYDFEHKFTASCLRCWSTTDRALAKQFWDYDYSAKTSKDYCVKNNNIDTRLILKSWLSLKKLLIMHTWYIVYEMSSKGVYLRWWKLPCWQFFDNKIIA